MNAPEPIADADVIPEEVAGEVVPMHPEPQPPVSTAVARRERRSEVIRPLNVDQLVDSMAEYQQLLPRLLDDSDYQNAGRGKRFVKKSGWRKIATAFDLDVQIIRSTVERDEHGAPARAEVWARAIAPSGRSMDGDGYCSVDEDRFSGPRGNKSKLENDLRATATTRAMNRAISGLVGMGEVSAEEMGGGGQDAGPAHGPAANADHCRTASIAITAFCAGDTTAAAALWEQISAALTGYMPEAAATALTLAYAAAKASGTDLPWNAPGASGEAQAPGTATAAPDAPDAPTQGTLA